MLSAVGACVTVAGSIGAGYCLCREKSERAAQLFLLGRMFEMTAGEIGYSRSFLPDIFSETGRRLGRGKRELPQSWETSLSVPGSGCWTKRGSR